jgi:hypothetical protein
MSTKGARQPPPFYPWSRRKKHRQEDCRCRNFHLLSTGAFLSCAAVPFDAFVKFMAIVTVTFAALVADMFAVLITLPAFTLLAFALAMLAPILIIIDLNHIMRGSCSDRRDLKG